MLTLPTNACDCHIHIYGDRARFPLAPTATFAPPLAPVAAYQQVQQALGLARVVLAQPTAYGFDNRCLLDALAQFNEGVGAGQGARARGVAMVAPDVSQAQLHLLHQAGVRGVRYMMVAGAGGPLGWDSLAAAAARIAPLGWHLTLQLDGRELPQRLDLINSLTCPVVIDHTGKFLEPVALSDPAFEALLAILQRPDRWLKIAAPYETSQLGPPGYGDVAALAQAALHAHPDRCLWGSNWPHPNRSPVPSEADLLDLLGQWCQSPAVRHQVLVDNPARLYGF